MTGTHALIGIVVVGIVIGIGAGCVVRGEEMRHPREIIATALFGVGVTGAIAFVAFVLEWAAR